jgi:hypothetical protein
MWSAAGAATIVTTTTRANVEAATGLTGAVITFENIANGAFNQITLDGVTFSAPGSLSVDNLFAGFNTVGKSLNSVSNTALSFDFAAPITGFGFFFGASDHPWTLSAYDSRNNLLETLVIPPTRQSNNGSFFGVIAPGITRATMTTALADYVLIDDFHTSTAPIGAPGAIPEPATWAMMILGFGGVGALMRRRQNLGLRPDRLAA